VGVTVTSMADTEQGLDLARAFYAEVVAPVLAIPHAACLIGEGSEVLGYDTERSTDHEWGPRLQVLVELDQVPRTRELIEDVLPDRFHGFPTRWFSLHDGQVTHHVEIDTAENWLAERLPTLPTDPDLAVWLAAPQQHLLQLTAGAVFRDDVGVLTRRRRTYEWYPDDLWRWMIASQWHAIGDTEPLLGRSIDNGDDRNARLLTARLCRLVVEMAYLQNRHYRPYGKWVGRGFAELPVGHSWGPLIDEALLAPPVLARDEALQRLLLAVAAEHNRAGISDHVDPVIKDFSVGINDAVRPFPVLNSSAFIDATVAAIVDPGVKNLPRVGAIDQLTDTSDLLINFTSWPDALASTYRRLLT
jgi:uncharacterized protein DUF4037